MSVSLQAAPFDITAFSIPKPTVNPANPGLLGSIEMNFSVTGPGKGEIHVIDVSGDDVFAHELPDFATWDQSFSWDVHTTTGQALGDGVYTIRLIATGAGGRGSGDKGDTIHR